MHCVTYNIRYGLGQDQRFDLARIAATVEGADVIALQEVERFWPRSGMVDQAAELAHLLNAYYWIYGPVYDVDASERDEGGNVVNRRRQFGPMILSKTPILSARVHALPKLGPDGDYEMNTGALEGVIETAAGPLRVYSVHLSARSQQDRLLQIEHLLEILQQAPQQGGAWSGVHPDPTAGWSDGQPPPMPENLILLGDFNAEPDSQEYRILTGQDAPANGALRLSDASCLIAGANGAEISWSPYPGAVPNREMRLDYCFLSKSLGPKVRAFRIDRQALGSDHYPCWTVLDL